jgi:hypothetical protein
MRKGVTGVRTAAQLCAARSRWRGWSLYWLRCWLIKSGEVKMDKDDRVAQALDDFWAAMDHFHNENKDDPFVAISTLNLICTYARWVQLSKPPSDPHKEWVDAEKMKPNDVFQPVLVKRDAIDGEIALGKFCWQTKEWWVQPFKVCAYVSDTVRYWRYIPQDDDNG